MATKSETTPKKRVHKSTRLTADEIKTIIPTYKETGATLPQARFAAAYVTNGFNGRQAYIDAVCHNATPKNADRKATVWLRDPAVIACLQQHTNDWLGQIRQKLEGELIATLYAQAFYDPKDFVTTEGEVAFDEWEKLPISMRRCVEGIEKRMHGKDANVETVTIKLVDRSKAITMLSQYVSLMQGANANLNINVTPETEVLMRALFQQAKPVGGRPPKKAVAEKKEEKKGVVGFKRGG